MSIRERIDLLENQRAALLETVEGVFMHYIRCVPDDPDEMLAAWRLLSRARDELCEWNASYSDELNKLLWEWRCARGGVARAVEEQRRTELESAITRS